MYVYIYICIYSVPVLERLYMHFSVVVVDCRLKLHLESHRC